MGDAKGFMPETQAHQPWPGPEEIKEANEVMGAMYASVIAEGFLDMKLDFREFTYLTGMIGLLAFEAGRLKCLKELGFDDKFTQQEAIDSMGVLRDSFWRKEG